MVVTPGYDDYDPDMVVHMGEISLLGPIFTNPPIFLSLFPTKKLLK